MGFPTQIISGDPAPAPKPASMTRDELIAALEKARGPDRSLDDAIRQLAERATRSMLMVAMIDIETGETSLAAPEYTGSRDAMLPGAERLDWFIYFGGWPSEYGTTEDDGMWHAECCYRQQPADAPPTTGLYRQYFASAATEPLARRIAEIKALVKP